MPSLSSRTPPGKAVKPLSLVAPKLGEFQCNVPASFNLPPATLSPPRKSDNSIHSELLGICHPVGQTPCTPLGFVELLEASFITAAHVYNSP